MKSNQPLWKVSIATTLEAEDAVAEMLGAVFGQPASSYFDLKSGRSTVSIFCDTRPEKDLREKISRGLARIKHFGLNVDATKVLIRRMPREDWAESWKRHFKPIELGNALLIKPSWNRRRPRPNQAVMVLDPGLSFGTGQHATTAFCLEKIAASRRRPGSNSPGRDTAPSFLDVGTGSGILAIAAAKLGYAPVHAFDFDPEAVRVARSNVQTNHVAGKIQITRDDVSKLAPRPSRRYDLICANLISTLLLAERKRLANRLQPDGTLVLAGILKSEFAEVQQAFETLGLHCVSSRVQREWRSGAFRFDAKSKR